MHQAPGQNPETPPKAGRATHLGEVLPSDNNHTEREIRPAVIIRKNSLFNRSEAGANAQAIMMSVYRTLKLRGLDPLETIVSALRGYVSTGTLPPLPA